MTAIRLLTEEEERQRRRDEPVPFNLSQLTPPQKRRLWTHLKQHHPGLAAVLQDAAVRDMRELFDATVFLPRSLVQVALDEH